MFFRVFKVGVLGISCKNTRMCVLLGSPPGGSQQLQHRQVGVSGHRVSHIKSAWSVFPEEIEPVHEFHPPGLPPGQIGLGGEVDEGVVVSNQGTFIALHKASPLCESVEDTQEFLFTCGVIAFSRDKLLAGIGNDMVSLH